MFELRNTESLSEEDKTETHFYKSQNEQRRIRCATDHRGHPNPRPRSPVEIRVNATHGFIPLWTDGIFLAWRFNKFSFQRYQEPDAVMEHTERLFADAIQAWGYACPIRFSYDEDLWDFEIAVRNADDCDRGSCVMARAFFPDSGRHDLLIYPKMFTLGRDEQVETLVHELGHIFGLRHFFANISETRWPSELFGRDEAFSIMNYGWQSRLTDTDRSDLYQLYRQARSHELKDINGTPIRLVEPYHVLRDRSPAFALATR